MAVAATSGGATVALAAATYVASSYRVKFRRREFLDLIELAKPAIIYHVRRMHFFAYDGFVMYTFECNASDFTQTVLDAVEFSNRPWDETG